MVISDRKVNDVCICYSTSYHFCCCWWPVPYCFDRRLSVCLQTGSWLVRYWHGYLSGPRCKWFTFGPADATATPIISCSSKIQNGLPFWCRLTQVVWEQRPLNGCVVVVVVVSSSTTAAVNVTVCYSRIHVASCASTCDKTCWLLKRRFVQCYCYDYLATVSSTAWCCLAEDWYVLKSAAVVKLSTDFQGGWREQCGDMASVVCA